MAIQRNEYQYLTPPADFDITGEILPTTSRTDYPLRGEDVCFLHECIGERYHATTGNTPSDKTSLITNVLSAFVWIFYDTKSLFYNNFVNTSSIPAGVIVGSGRNPIYYTTAYAGQIRTVADQTATNPDTTNGDMQKQILQSYYADLKKLELPFKYFSDSNCPTWTNTYTTAGTRPPDQPTETNLLYYYKERDYNGTAYWQRYAGGDIESTTVPSRVTITKPAKCASLVACRLYFQLQAFGRNITDDEGQLDMLRYGFCAADIVDASNGVVDFSQIGNNLMAHFGLTKYRYPGQIESETLGGQTIQISLLGMFTVWSISSRTKW